MLKTLRFGRFPDGEAKSINANDEAFALAA